MTIFFEKKLITGYSVSQALKKEAEDLSSASFVKDLHFVSVTDHN